MISAMKFEMMYQGRMLSSEIVMKANSAPDYKNKLRKELDEIKNSEMWRAGAAVRKLRPENR